MLSSRNITKLIPRLRTSLIAKNVSHRHSSALTSNRRFSSHPSCYINKRSNRLLQSQTNQIWSTRYISITSYLNDEYKIVSTPAFAESVSEGDVKWDKNVGDFVKEDEIILEIETDKTAIPIPAPVSGIIEEIFIPDGEKVVAGDQLCKIKITDAADTPAAPPKAMPTTEATPTAPTEQQSAPVPDVAGPIPTVPPPVPPLPTAPTSVVTPPPPPISPPTMAPAGSRTEKRVKMSRMRQKIAERLKSAQNTNAMLTTFNEIDMSNVIELRKKFQDLFVKKHGLKLGFMSPFVKASCYALQNQPIVNAVIESNEIVYRDYIDISVAVATPKGLVVPVIRNVENMNYTDIEKEIMSLGEKAKDGTLAIEDMDGGTFTISNGGVFGSMFGTPIINPPQSAILGMHGVFDRPVAIDGKVEIRPMMYIALTYDHRLIDGREAVLFLRKIKSAVEDPRVLLLDV